MLEALAIPWRRRADFVRALAVPFALLAAFYVGWYFLQPKIGEMAGWTFALAYWGVFAALFTLFAVACHRLVLLDSRPLRRVPPPSWTRREGRFFLFVLGLWIVYLVVWWVVMAVAANVWPRVSGDMSTASLKVIELAGKLPALYVIARLSLVFPATAIDRNASLRWAWRLSRGNGWRLVVVVTVLPWLLFYLFGLLYRDEPTMVETVVLIILGTALFAFEIAALSVAYRELAVEEEREEPS